MTAQIIRPAFGRPRDLVAETERDSAEKLEVITRRDLTAEGVMALASIAVGDLVCWRCHDSRCPKAHHTGTVARVFPGGMIRIQGTDKPHLFVTLPIGVLTVLRKGGDARPCDSEGPGAA